jgi:hypothetical protein
MSISFTFCGWNYIYISHFSYAWYTPKTSHPGSFELVNSSYYEDFHAIVSFRMLCLASYVQVFSSPPFNDNLLVLTLESSGKWHNVSQTPAASTFRVEVLPCWITRYAIPENRDVSITVVKTPALICQTYVLHPVWKTKFDIHITQHITIRVPYFCNVYFFR